MKEYYIYTFDWNRFMTNNHPKSMEAGMWFIQEMCSIYGMSLLEGGVYFLKESDETAFIMNFYSNMELCFRHKTFI